MDGERGRFSAPSQVSDLGTAHGSVDLAGSLVGIARQVGAVPADRSKPEEVDGDLRRSKDRVSVVPLDVEAIEPRIQVVRGIRVMLDVDLAALYGVTTGALDQAVDRNPGRFPGDFAFRLTVSETADLKSQTVISNRGRGGRRRSPRALEHGVAMLSSVLRSQRAIAMNILVVRAFVRLRQMQGELRRRLKELGQRLDTELTEIWQVLDALENPPAPLRHPLGFGRETPA
jgi:hypothetical protein